MADTSDVAASRDEQMERSPQREPVEALQRAARVAINPDWAADVVDELGELAVQGLETKPNGIMNVKCHPH